MTPTAYMTAGSPYAQQTLAEPSVGKSRKGTICCGCSLLIFVLSSIIAFLSAAVIGLAAGTGIEASRANDVANQLAVLNSSIATSGPTKTTTVTAAATATSWNDLDNGCSDNPTSITGTTYTSFSLLGGLKFTMYCNKDAPGTPYMSLFVANMNTCMDACAAYSKYIPTFFGNNKNTTCAGVSFIPLWTNKANATAGGAPGNCYLKPAPQNATALEDPNIGTECHAAILAGNS